MRILFIYKIFPDENYQFPQEPNGKDDESKYQDKVHGQAQEQKKWQEQNPYHRKKSCGNQKNKADKKCVHFLNTNNAFSSLLVERTSFAGHLSEQAVP